MAWFDLTQSLSSSLFSFLILVMGGNGLQNSIVTTHIIGEFQS